jgi:hypothetical protein
MEKRIVELTRDPHTVSLADRKCSLFIDVEAGVVFLDEGEGDGRVNGAVFTVANGPRFTVRPSGSGGELMLDYAGRALEIGVTLDRTAAEQWALSANELLSAKSVTATARTTAAAVEPGHAMGSFGPADVKSGRQKAIGGQRLEAPQGAVALMERMSSGGSTMSNWPGIGAGGFGIPGVSVPGVPAAATPGQASAPSMMMVPRCTFRFEKMSGGIRVSCSCEDATACAMMQNLFTMLAGGLCSLCCMMNGIVILTCNLTMGMTRSEMTAKGATLTCTSGDRACCEMIHACNDALVTCLKSGCVGCIMLNGTPVCCGTA